MIKRNIAFTLAEVMLAVSIIAIVAALTVPNTKKNTDNSALMVKARSEMLKIDTALSQVNLLNIVSTNGTNATRSSALLNAMTNYLKITNNCGNISNSNYCFLKTTITSLGSYNPVNNGNCASAIMNDGTEFALCIVSQTPIADGNILADNKKFYGYVAADVNGAKNPPNQRAKDVYYYVITDEGTLTLADSTIQTDYEANAIAQEY